MATVKATDGHCRRGAFIERPWLASWLQQLRSAAVVGMKLVNTSEQCGFLRRTAKGEEV